MTMITLYHSTTGETQTVTSSAGYDMSEWTEIEGRPGLTIDERYDGTQWVTVIPPKPPISQADFLALFTAEEQVITANSNDAAMKTTLMILQAYQLIYLEDIRVDNGLTLMISLGIITEDRKVRILAGEPPE